MCRRPGGPTSSAVPPHGGPANPSGREKVALLVRHVRVPRRVSVFPGTRHGCCLLIPRSKREGFP